MIQNLFTQVGAMRNILKTGSKSSASILFVFVLFSSTVSAASFAATQCDKSTYVQRDHQIVDVLCRAKGSKVFLMHDQKKQLIWLSSKEKTYSLSLLKLEKNADPSLVGEEKSIAFLFNKSIHLNDREFFALTIAERSMRGDGGGQCGAGSEIYFIALEIKDSKIKELKRMLISSCKESIYLADDGKNAEKSIFLNESNEVEFRWSTYPNFDTRVTGKFNFLSKELVVNGQLN